MPPTSWELRVRAKRDARSESIPLEWRLHDIPTPEQCHNVIEWPQHVLLPEELTITETSPLVILANIHASIWSAEDVTRAFCHRAAVAQQLTNCLTEIMFNGAISIAQELDRYHGETGSLKGPLHGLPISFMDRFRIAGVETSSGFVSWLGLKEPPDAEGPLVQHMRKLGAIPICKTNVPQSMMLGNTTNNIFGSTLNPFDRRLSAGGAAGGEGALLAMRGSAFGWATEVAGSTRIPATFNNLFSMRVSAGRLPITCIALSNISPLYMVTIGMLSWDLPILQHMARLTLGSPSYSSDPVWLDMPWRESRYQKFQRHRPTLAVLMDDGHVHPQPPLKRALIQVAEQLRRRGFEVIDWHPPSHAQAVELMFRIIGADGAADIRKNIASSGEPPVQQLKKWFVEAQGAASLPLSEYWALCKARSDFVAEYLAYWQASAKRTACGKPVDGVIMPVTAHAACFENDLNYFGYSAIVNQLDFVSVTIPTGHVDRSIDVEDPKLLMHNAEDAQIQTAYNPAVAHGMPLGLQVMCRRLEEESALALADIILHSTT